MGHEPLGDWSEGHAGVTLCFHVCNGTAGVADEPSALDLLFGTTQQCAREQRTGYSEQGHCRGE